MSGTTKWYACIDLKSYYASVECVDRGLDPLTTNLVVADESRSDGTICLAVSPSLKALGVPGRPRLFEVKQRLAEIKALTGQTVPYITACPGWHDTLPLSLLAMKMMYSAGTSKMGSYYMAGQKMNNTIIEYINGMEVVKIFNRDVESYQQGILSKAERACVFSKGSYDTGRTSRSYGRPGNQSIGSLSGRGRRFLLPCDAQNMGRHSPRHTQGARK